MGWDMDLLKPGDPGQVGKYRLIGRLGDGGMGRVFLGVSPDGRQVAVKLIHSGLADDRQFRERFAREIEAARQVGGFHTAPVVDADPDADPPWMVTVYIHGPSLQDAVTERGPLSLDQVCMLGAGLAEGLAAIHACGLIHGDLKPSHVILAEDGPRIIDFGTVRAAGASWITMTGPVFGMYSSYMSPEQVQGEAAGPASDVFSLGGILIFAATARTPFGEDSFASVVCRILDGPPDLTGLTDEGGFRQLISECLAKSPADRPPLADIPTRLIETGNDAAAASAAAPAAEPLRYAVEPPSRDAAAPEPPHSVEPAAGRERAKRRHRSTKQPEDAMTRAVRAAVKPGLLAFNPPTEMIQGRWERVEVGIARSFELRDALVAGLRGRGEPQFEQISTSSVMSVELSGPSFEVISFGPPEQIVPEMAQWEFNVRSYRIGNQTLTLCVCLRINSPVTGGNVTVPVLERPIRIRVDIALTAHRFLVKNWQWLIATILGLGGALATWITLVH